jgi:hypothetical protein
MLSLLILSVLSQAPMYSPMDDCGFDKLCSSGARDADITIRITGTIVSAQQFALDAKPLELEGAYAFYAHSISTGHVDAHEKKERYVVLDYNPRNKDKAPLMFSMTDRGILVNSRSPEYFVAIWPENYSLPDRRELLALREAVFQTENIDAAIAKIDKFYKKKRIN